MTNIYKLGLDDNQENQQWTTLNILSSDSGGDGSNKRRAALRDEFGNITYGNLESSKKKSAMHIATSISLPMPANLNFSYQANWNGADVNVLDSTINALISDKSQSPGFVETLKNELAKTGASTGFRKTLKDQGLAHNPRKEMFFGGPNFRTFPLQWNFSFKSKSDVANFDSITQALAIHMHPEFSNGVAAGTWKIPESFSIEFSGANVRKINECVLTAMQIDTSASGAGWRALVDGSPAHVGLSLTFMEIQPLTKENIRQGS